MKFLNQWLLTILLMVPLGGAAATLGLRRIAVIRRVAMGTTLAAFAISLLILVPFRWRQALSYDESSRGSVKLATRAPLVLGVEYHVAVDGLSFPFVVFTTLIFPLLCAASCNDGSKGAGYFAALLGLEFSILGTFLSFDFLMMSAFLAISVAAVFGLVRLSAAGAGVAKMILIYLSLGIACLLVSLVAMRMSGRPFDLVRLAASAPREGSAIVIIAGVAFLVWMAIPPLHSWLMVVAANVPAPASIAIATMIPITGAYGFNRVALPLISHAGGVLTGVFAALGIASILYGGLCAMASEDLKSFVAYSITCAMGYVLLAADVGTPGALDGAVLLLIGQGLASAMLLLLANVVKPGETGERAPMWAAFFGVAWLAWLVAPVLLGQIIVLSASADAMRSANTTTLRTISLVVAAALGMLINGASAARIVKRTFVSAAQTVEGQPIDLSPVDITILSVLGTAAILLGIVPGVLCFTFTHPAARALLGAP